MSAGLLDPLIPMDTIFVKHVRENGPATKAGLSTGNRLIPTPCLNYQLNGYIFSHNFQTLDVVLILQMIDSIFPLLCNCDSDGIFRYFHLLTNYLSVLLHTKLNLMSDFMLYVW